MQLLCLLNCKYLFSCIEPHYRISLQAFHCSEPSTRHLSCLPLFLSLLTYEVYYNTEAAEGDAAPQVQHTSRLKRLSLRTWHKCQTLD